MVTSPNEPRLSDRERTVLLLAADGKTDKEIARSLELSLKTVGTYWDRMRRKFNASSRTQVLAQFLRMQAHSQHEIDGIARIFAESDEGVWVLGRAGDTMYVNRRAAEILDRDPEDLAEVHPSEVVGPGNHRKIKRLLNNARLEPSTAMTVLEVADRRRSFKWWASALRDPGGRAGAVLLKITDATPLIENKEALARVSEALTLFASQSSDAVVEFDASLKVISCCNWMREWSETFGKPLVGRKIEDLHDVFLPSERWARNIQKVLKAGGTTKFESGLVRPRTKLQTHMVMIERPESETPTILSITKPKNSGRPYFARY